MGNQSVTSSKSTLHCDERRRNIELSYAYTTAFLNEYGVQGHIDAINQVPAVSKKVLCISTTCRSSAYST